MLNNDIRLYYTYMYVLTIKKTHYDVPKLKNVLERSRKRECAKIFTSWPIVHPRENLHFFLFRSWPFYLYFLRSVLSSYLTALASCESRFCIYCIVRLQGFSKEGPFILCVARLYLIRGSHMNPLHDSLRRSRE